MPDLSPRSKRMTLPSSIANGETPLATHATRAFHPARGTMPGTDSSRVLWRAVGSQVDSQQWDPRPGNGIGHSLRFGPRGSRVHGV